MLPTQLSALQGFVIVTLVVRCSCLTEGPGGDVCVIVLGVVWLTIRAGAGSSHVPD